MYWRKYESSVLGLNTGAAERTSRFGRSVARGGTGIEQWGACRYTAVFMPFSVNAMVWSGEHRTFVVEEFIQNGGSPIMTQRANDETKKERKG
jgi:hypothetical protein